MSKAKMAVAASLALVASGFTAQAADPQGWQFEITPMAWLAGMEGDGTVRGKDFEFDKGFSDLIDSVDMAGGLFGTAQYDRYLFWAQLDFISASTDNLDVEDQPKRAEVDSDLFLGEAAVGYQVDGWAKDQTIDILFGVRVARIETGLSIDRGAALEDDSTMVDPMLVIRPSVPVLPSKIKGLSFNGTMAIGGGADADMVYELQPQFQYDASENLSIRLGYRRVGYKFDGEGDNKLDMQMAGLILGAGFRF